MEKPSVFQFKYGEKLKNSPIREQILTAVYNTKNIGSSLTGPIKKDIISKLKISNPFLQKVVGIEVGILEKINLSNELEELYVGTNNYKEILEKKIRYHELTMENINFLSEIKHHPDETSQYWFHSRILHSKTNHHSDKSSILAPLAVQRFIEEEMDMKFRYNQPVNLVTTDIVAFIGKNEIPCKIIPSSLSLQPNLDKDKAVTTNDVLERIDFARNNMLTVITSENHRDIDVGSTEYSRKINQKMSHFRNSIIQDVKSNSNIKGLEFVIPVGQLPDDSNNTMSYLVSNDGIMHEITANLLKNQFKRKAPNLI